ncbi:MAG TPA: MarR family transcriptional regulator [Verrucomicrobiae bacterium]|jgi:DNA-binding MarR family transcriptional regulator|nr:MarR family transcriptional regulator [Verrucomicrobiae bacterium]
MQEQEQGEGREILCACATLRKAARSVTQLYDLVLQPAGLKLTQFTALRSIYEAGELAQWKFARQHGVAVETLSRRLAALRHRGLVSVRIGGNHGERIYTLTEGGRDAYMRALPYWDRAQQRFRQTLGIVDYQSLLQVCEASVEAAHEAEQLRASNGIATAH